MSECTLLKHKVSLCDVSAVLFSALLCAFLLFDFLFFLWLLLLCRDDSASASCGAVVRDAEVVGGACVIVEAEYEKDEGGGGDDDGGGGDDDGGGGDDDGGGGDDDGGDR